MRRLDCATIDATDLAAVRTQEAGEAGEQRALASPVRPEQAEHFAVLHAERRGAKRFDLAEALVQAVD